MKRLEHLKVYTLYEFKNISPILTVIGSNLKELVISVSIDDMYTIGRVCPNLIKINLGISSSDKPVLENYKMFPLLQDITVRFLDAEADIVDWFVENVLVSAFHLHTLSITKAGGLADDVMMALYR